MDPGGLTGPQRELLETLLVELDQERYREFALNPHGSYAWRLHLLSLTGDGGRELEWEGKYSIVDAKALKDAGFIRLDLHPSLGVQYDIVHGKSEYYLGSLTLKGQVLQQERAANRAVTRDASTAALVRPQPLPEPLPVGHVLASRYRIISLLGNGAMAHVYRALDPRLNEEVALKVPMEATRTQPQALERFRREVSMARRVAHPNVCQLYDYDEDNGVPFYVMPLLAGEALHKALEGGACEKQRALDIVRQVAFGLDAIHAEAIVHRDIKPGNIMISADRVRILDLGLAKDEDGINLTQAGEIRGTPSYMSPEQCRGESTTARSDVYGLAAVAFELLTGKQLFEGTKLDVVLKQMNLVPDLSSVPEEFRAVIARGLEKDPTRRYSSAGDFAAALLSAFQRQDSTDETETMERRIEEPEDADEGHPTILRVGVPDPDTPAKVWARLGTDAQALLTHIWRNTKDNFIFETQADALGWDIPRWKDILHVLIDQEGLLKRDARRHPEGIHGLRFPGYALTRAGRTLMVGVSPRTVRQSFVDSMLSRDFEGSTYGTPGDLDTYGDLWTRRDSKEREVLLRVWERYPRPLLATETDSMREEWGVPVWNGIVVRLEDLGLIGASSDEYGSGWGLTAHGRTLMSELVRDSPK